MVLWCASTFNYQDKIKVNWIADLDAEKPYYIPNEKTKDVYDLFKFISDNNKDFYAKHLKKFSIENYKKTNPNHLNFIINLFLLIYL